MLRRNLWIYGLGGLVVPFIGIKVIDVLLTPAGSGVSVYDDRFTSLFDNVISAVVIDRRRVSASDHGAGAVVVFHWQANGSLIHKDHVIRGSALIGPIVYRRGLLFFMAGPPPPPIRLISHWRVGRKQRPPAIPN